MRFKLIALLLTGLSLFAYGQIFALDKKYEIDKNFTIEELGNKQYRFYDFTQKPFSLSGFAWYDKEHKLCRFSQGILLDSNVNSWAKFRATQTSGGMLRFKTDSKSIALKAKLLSSDDMSHMPRTGSSGFDRK